MELQTSRIDWVCISIFYQYANRLAHLVLVSGRLNGLGTHSLMYALFPE